MFACYAEYPRGNAMCSFGTSVGKPRLLLDRYWQIHKKLLESLQIVGDARITKSAEECGVITGDREETA